MPRKRTGRKGYKVPDQNLQRHRLTSFETACSLANGPSLGGGLRDKHVFCVPRELQRLLSLFCLWEESVDGA